VAETEPIVTLIGKHTMTAVKTSSVSRQPTTIMAACAIAALTAMIATARPAAAFQLITAQEAALPPSKTAPLELRGSPTRRPNVTVVSPRPNAGLIHSPLELKLKFRAFGGAKINPESVVITYLKQPTIDITQRIAPYITAGGIDVSQADVPPGLHRFWIELKDDDGRVGGTEFSFQVAK
jgi:hypothetical protein